MTHRRLRLGALAIAALAATSCQAAPPGGDVIVIAGDSRAAGRGLHPQLAATDAVSVLRRDGTWHAADDPIDIDTRVGSPWPLLAAHLAASGRRGIFVMTAEGSTDVYGPGSDQWAKPHEAYTRMIQLARAVRRPVSVVIMMLGPNAIVNSVTPTRDGYRRAVETLADNVAADIPGAPPLLIDLCGEVGTGRPPDRARARENVIGGILDAARANPRVWIGADLRDQTYTDRVHPQTDAELRTVADRTWQAWLAHRADRRLTANAEQ